MNMTLIPISAIAATALLFSGCASYNATSLNSLSSETMLSKADIVIAAKEYTKADCKKYLDRDVIKKGYQPVQLYIENNTDKSYCFSLNRVSLSCARPEEVADKVHTSTVGRIVGYGAAAVFAFPIFAIPAVVDGVKSAQANEELDNDFSAKIARDQILAPHSHLNKLLLVPVNEYQPTFTVSLMDQDSHLKILNVIAHS